MPNKCGAKTRSGHSCKRFSMLNGRCKLHGGASTGAPRGNTNALKHGIYSEYHTPEEIAIVESMNKGSVDEELLYCRIMLHRALEAEFIANGQPELAEVIKRERISSETIRATRFRVRNYFDVIDKIIGRIESLVKKRLELMQVGDAGDGPGENPHAQTTISPDESRPENPIL